MCGIAGYAVTGRRPLHEALARAERALTHRGPDDGGIQFLPLGETGEVGLANRRLSILDLSPAGHQPMLDRATGNWIAYNGEVFNFRAVRARLEHEGVLFESDSDTEVVLKAYGRWGVGCLNEFRGMFGLAIWDPKRRELLLVRDRFGIKPLYYYQSGSELFFASEVRSLLATGAVKRRISPEGLMNFLSFGSVCDPNTLIEGVFSVPPGSYLLWKDGRISIDSYWDLVDAAGQAGAAGSGLDGQSLVSEVRDRLREAFSLHLVSDVPVSVFLSGGLDSSALVALLADSPGPRLQTFSMTFEEERFNEGRYSRLVAEQYGTDHRGALLHVIDFLDTIPDAIAAMDQPSLDGLNSYIISREVRKAGFKVALSGLGADELFGGYGSFRYASLLESAAGFLRRVPSTLRRGAGALLGASSRSSVRLRKVGSFLEASEAGVAPYILARSLYSLRQQRRLLRSWKDEVFEKAMEPLRCSVERASQLDPINRISYLELRHYMRNTLLRDTDCMSMASSIEVRVPFLDHKLAEFVFSIPGSLKVQSRRPKWLLAESLKSLLPEEILHRPKRGFVLPFDSWLREEARHDVEACFASWESSVLADYVDGNAVRSVWRSFLKGHTTWSRVWGPYVLRLWAQHHLEDATQDARTDRHATGAF